MLIQGVLLLVFGVISLSVQGQNLHIKEATAIQENPAINLAATQLPSQVTVPKKSSWINNAFDWYQKKSIQGDFQIHGFIGQSYILSSHNNVFGHSTSGAGGSFGLTEAGLNASFRPLPKLLISAQVLSRRAGEGSSGMPRLDFAFLDYRLYSKWGSLSAQFGVWWPIVNDRDTEKAVFFPGMNGNLTREVSYIGRGIYETNDKRIRLGISGIWLNTNYDVNNPDERVFGLPVSSGSLQFSPIYFSAQYNAERWSFTTEYAIRHFAYSGFHHDTIDKTNFFGESFYVQGEYRITPKWETFIRYDVLFTDRTDKDGKKWASQDPAILRGLEHSRYAKDLTVGLRWNVTPEFMVRAEYHHVNGTGWLSRLDNPVLKQSDKDWDLFAIQASYRF